MATPINEKTGTDPAAIPQLTISTSPTVVAKPQPVALATEETSSTLSPTPREKSLDIQHSNVSTPRSCRHSNPFDTDVEAMIPTSTNENCYRKSTTVSRSDYQVWPGKDYWKQRAKADKMNRSCTCMARLSKRTRIIVKVVIGLLIVGIAVGVGFGVSKPLGAPIWGKKKD